MVKTDRTRKTPDPAQHKALPEPKTAEEIRAAIADLQAITEVSLQAAARHRISVLMERLKKLEGTDAHD